MTEADGRIVHTIAEFSSDGAAVEDNNTPVYAFGAAGKLQQV